MLELYDALEALQKTGTMGAAGVMLRISQSAVSKRIATLEHESGKKLIEKVGRRVVLTTEGQRLVNKISPLLAEIRFELNAKAESINRDIQVGVSESILASWGAKYLMLAENQISPAKIALHAHRGPLLAQMVASGIYQAGVIAGEAGSGTSLNVIELGHEPMIILSRKYTKPAILISIEAQATTWQAIKRRAMKNGLVPDRFVESYFSAANLAMAGFGRALIPAGVALSLKLPADVEIHPVSGLTRPINLLARAHSIGKPEIKAVIENLKEGLRSQIWFAKSKNSR